MKPIPIQSHRLSHLPELRLDPALFEPTYDDGCSMEQCNAHCCRDGVFLDPAEKQKILDHAEIIVKQMDPHQVKDPERWFDGEIVEDADFPSGTCTGTTAVEYGCVFLNSRGWCVLQKAAVEAGMHKFDLKPYFCVAFPLTISSGVVTVDDGSFTNRSQCCSPGRNPQLAPADVCREELTFMLGSDGLDECDAVRAGIARNDP